MANPKDNRVKPSAATGTTRPVRVDPDNENAIRRVTRRRPAEPSKPGARAAAADSKPHSSRPSRPAAKPDSAQSVPPEIWERFIGIGSKYYFPDGTPAFTDRGTKLTTPSENTEVIRSLVSIAHARGWDRITVTGTERFRKEAWFAAQRVGIAV